MNPEIRALTALATIDQAVSGLFTKGGEVLDTITGGFVLNRLPHQGVPFTQRDKAAASDYFLGQQFGMNVLNREDGVVLENKVEVLTGGGGVVKRIPIDSSRHLLVQHSDAMTMHTLTLMHPGYTTTFHHVETNSTKGTYIKGGEPVGVVCNDRIDNRPHYHFYARGLDGEMLTKTQYSAHRVPECIDNIESSLRKSRQTTLYWGIPLTTAAAAVAGLAGYVFLRDKDPGAVGMISAGVGAAALAYGWQVAKRFTQATKEIGRRITELDGVKKNRETYDRIIKGYAPRDRAI